MDHLFKTTDSVIEILWDVALAFFIVRIALTYFFFTFTTSTLLSWIVYTYRQYLLLRLSLVSGQQQQQQHIAASQTQLLILPLFQIVAGLVVARYVVADYDVPRVAWFRLSIGGLAAVFLAGAEAVLGVVVYAFSQEGGGGCGGLGGIWEEMDGWWWVSVAAVLGGLGVFAVMPAALMGFERAERVPAAAVAKRAEGGKGEMGMQGLDGKGA
ncbi:hypothetical protein CSAL01_10087 [Colletotrichum salicis]|uniref:Uncharacterized protein n=1 Tax=Colletotrichum salicis TaxID=1209931 RepID=A0A135V5J7_9PEZI|nr:hypothetical protein CSAL01_10087 [Colletotrichum salicis]